MADVPLRGWNRSRWNTGSQPAGDEAVRGAGDESLADRLMLHYPWVFPNVWVP